MINTNLNSITTSNYTGNLRTTGNATTAIPFSGPQTSATDKTSASSEATAANLHDKKNDLKAAIKGGTQSQIQQATADHDGDSSLATSLRNDYAKDNDFIQAQLQDAESYSAQGNGSHEFNNGDMHHHIEVKDDNGHKVVTSTDEKGTVTTTNFTPGDHEHASIKVTNKDGSSNSYDQDGTIITQSHNGSNGKLDRSTSFNIDPNGNPIAHDTMDDGGKLTRSIQNGKVAFQEN